MIINLQYPEACELLNEMLAAISEEKRAQFADRVKVVAHSLGHECPPDLEVDVLWVYKSSNVI